MIQLYDYRFIWSWDGANSAEENMARDREMLGALREPFLQTSQIRFYSWNSPSITVGYSQRPKEWVHLIRAHELGIEVVQRPTGGGVVFHQRDFTWSIAATQEALGFTSIQECYQKIHQAVAVGLKRHFGLPLYLASCKDAGAPSFCFAVPVGYDIMASNRKLVGGAIRWTKKGVLYQGTLPLTRNFSLFKDVVLPSKRSWLEALDVSPLPPMGGEERVNGNGKWQYQNLIEALLDGFHSELGWEISARGSPASDGMEDSSNEMRHVWAGNRRG